MDRPSFLLFVRAVLPVRAPEAPSGGLLRLGSQVFTEASCSPRLHCAEWWCVVLSDWPRHHGGSGRDWPDKSATRPSGRLAPVLARQTGTMGDAFGSTGHLLWLATTIQWMKLVWISDAPPLPLFIIHFSSELVLDLAGSFSFSGAGLSLTSPRVNRTWMTRSAICWFRCLGVANP